MMTTIASEGPRGSWLGRAAKALGQALLAAYRLGGRTLVVAPIIAAVAILPEFAQHAAEIKLGMFESKEAFAALNNDPTRWAFGYAKIAGLVFAMLLTARFWATGSVRRAVLIPPRDLLRFALVVALLFGSDGALGWFAERAPTPFSTGLSALNFLLQAILIVPALAALLSDRELGLVEAVRDRWPTAAMITLLVGAAFLPAQLLHSFNHRLAFGQPEAAVWGLMVFDSLLVGLIATLVGAAHFVGYRTGLSWRGWTVHPSQLARHDPEGTDEER